MVGHIVLDRPHRMNTISDELLEELSAAIDLLEDDDEVRAILVTGEGEKAFSAGADVQSMAGDGADPIEGQELSRLGQSTFGELEALICQLLRGSTASVSAAAGWSWRPVRTCASRANAPSSASPNSTSDCPRLGRDAATETHHRRGPREGDHPHRRALRRRETMADYGFVNEVVDSDGLEARALELATDLAGGPPIAQKFTKRAMLAGRDDTEAGLEYEGVRVRSSDGDRRPDGGHYGLHGRRRAELPGE